MKLNETITNIKNILAALGAADTSAKTVASEAKNNESEPKQNVSAKKSKLPDGYLSCKYTDLLNAVQYFPNGDAPTEHNAFWDITEKGKKCYWFCSDSPVGYVTVDGKVVTFKHHDDAETRRMKSTLKEDPRVVLQNAFERYNTSIAKKWAMERDWIPEYKYSEEDNIAEVGLCVQQALANSVDRSKITKMCFDHLDTLHSAIREHKTVLKEENCNSAERFIYASLFTGDVEMLHRLDDIDGNILPLPTEEDLIEFTEDDLDQFANIKVVFDRMKERHCAASVETWMSAQCYALNMPTKMAIEFIYGDKAVGKKKYRRCEVAYSRQANQVFKWLMEEIAIMFNEDRELCESLHLEKWIEIWSKSEASSFATQMFNLVKKYDLISLDENGERESGIISMIAIDPDKMVTMFWDILTDASAKYNYDFASELETGCSGVCVTATATVADGDDEDNPF